MSDIAVKLRRERIGFKTCFECRIGFYTRRFRLTHPGEQKRSTFTGIYF